MARTTEGKVKDAVKKVFAKYGHELYHFWPVQNGMGKPGLDAHCCFRGEAFFVETKAPGKKPTPRQQVTIDEIAEANGRVFVVDGPESLKPLEQWLEAVDAIFCFK
jgi:hypothetical protein